MSRNAQQVLADAHEWGEVAEHARTVNDLVEGLAALVTTANVRALERLMAEGSAAAVDELGATLVEVMKRLTLFAEPVAGLVDAALARITTLRIETAELVREHGAQD